MEVKKKYELTLRFDFGNNSLFDLGYISIDIFHLIVFSELIQNNEFDKMERFFINNKNPFSLTRDSVFLKSFRDQALIKSVRNGSIEIIISEVSLVATVLIPYIIYKLQKRDNHKSQKYYFEVNSNDTELNILIDRFKEGYYGRGDESIQWLFNTLNNRGYDISIRGMNSFAINKVIERYERRIVKIIDNIK